MILLPGLLIIKRGRLKMKLKVLFGIFLIISLTACSSTKQTDFAEEVIFYGEGEQNIDINFEGRDGLIIGDVGTLFYF